MNLVQRDANRRLDFMLILGTRLNVHGPKLLAAKLAREVHRRGGIVVYVDHSVVQQKRWSDLVDYHIQWTCDEWVQDLQRRWPGLQERGSSVSHPIILD